MAIRDKDAEYPEYDRDEDDWRRYEFPRWSNNIDGAFGFDGEHRTRDYRAPWMGRDRNITGAPLPEPLPGRPESAMEALMQAAPGDRPQESYEELADRLGAIRSVLDSGVLDAGEQEVISRLFFQGQSLRDVALDLGIGKTTVASIRDRAFETIRENLA